MRRPRTLAEARALAREVRQRRTTEALTAIDTDVPSRDRFGAFGQGSVIVPPARVTCPDRIFIGDRVVILDLSFLSVTPAVDGYEPRFVVGDRTRIGRMAHIACVGRVEFGADVLTAERIFVADTYHRYDDPSLPVIRQPMAAPRDVVIERGSFLGIGAIVLAGVTVGEHGYVAAASVVTHDVEPYTLVAGNPARPVRRWDPAREEWRRVTSAAEAGA